MGHAEGGIQVYVLQRLEILERQGLVYAFRANSFSGRVTRFDGSQGYVKNAKKGMPDVVACIGGSFVGIECKSLIGRISPEQKQARETIEKTGGYYWIIRTPEEFENVLSGLMTWKKLAPVHA